MRRRYYSGVIEAIGDTQGLRGLERFSVSVTPDGSRTLHATCEIYDRNVSRDVIYSVDRDFRPMDACVRLIKDGSLLGAGRFHFDMHGGSLDCDSRVLGHVTQRVDQQGGFPSFGPHPLSCDIWHLARYDHASKQRTYHLTELVR
ncbi:MAG: hypothetical protein WAU48_05770 [Gammaproteobacteria bacterium]